MIKAFVKEETVLSKIEEIQHFLQRDGWDAAFITTPDNVFYVSGFHSNPQERLLGVMVFKNAEPFLISPLMEVPDVKAAGWSYEAVGHEDTDDAWDIVLKTIQKRGALPTSIA